MAAPQEKENSSRASLEQNRTESIEWQQKTGFSGLVQLTPGPRDGTTRSHHRTTAGTAARTCLYRYNRQELTLVRTAPRTTSWSHDRRRRNSRQVVGHANTIVSTAAVARAHRPWACQPCAGAAAIHAPTPRPRAAAPAAKGRVIKSSGGRVCTSARQPRRTELPSRATARPLAAAPAAKDRVTKSSGGRVCAGARQPRKTESQSRAAGGFARALARWAPCERLWKPL